MDINFNYKRYWYEDRIWTHASDQVKFSTGDVRNYLKTLIGIDEDDRMPVLTLKDMVNVKKNVPKDKSGNIVAVYYAYGAIDSGSSYADSENGINSEKVIRDLRRLKENEDVKAVVLRVNSPGGSAFGSEQIWYAVTEHGGAIAPEIDFLARA